MIGEIASTLMRIPLATPYKLAFGPVTHFDTILVRATAGGRVGVGEATILTGYTNETLRDSWVRVLATSKKLPGISTDAAKATIAADLRDAPFAATALTTAIEMLEGHPALQITRPERVPLLAGINATDKEGITREIEEALAGGYETLKIKVGFDVEEDLGRVAFIQSCNAGRGRLRIDANQGYDRVDACRFASCVDSTDVELLEQPCHADDWQSLKAVASVTNVPLMLDESIYTEADIERAARTGASFVKLKLMKFVSLDRLEKGLARIRELGMEPVLGNGVASDIGCWMEACVARRAIRNAGEMNGFLRQVRPLSQPPLNVIGGALQLAPDQVPRPDAAALERVTVETACFNRAGKTAGEVV